MNYINDYTVVLGVDAAHLPQLALVAATWARHKPSLLRRPAVVFYDEAGGLRAHDVIPAMPAGWRVAYVPWARPAAATLGGEGRFYAPQRQLMLAGFVHIPAAHVQTPYWLKLDLDVVATGFDAWVDPCWFTGRPAIVAPPWGYTKPAEQMLELDAWARPLTGALMQPPLQLRPEPGAGVLRHQRICSWCAFFETDFTRTCAHLAAGTCGPGGLPVPSQDGYHWYMARRLGRAIKTKRMKGYGWSVHSRPASLRTAVEAALCSPAG